MAIKITMTTTMTITVMIEATSRHNKSSNEDNDTVVWLSTAMIGEDCG